MIANLTFQMKQKLPTRKTVSSERDIAFGKHSNIPNCCIDFFVEEWEFIHIRKDDLYVRAVNSCAWGYVPCPECLGRGNKVHVRQCITECGKKCWKDF